MRNRHFIRPEVAVPLALQVNDVVAAHWISAGARQLVRNHEPVLALPQDP